MKAIPMLSSPQSSHIRTVRPTSDGESEDKDEIMALLKFFGKPMTASEISDANDLSVNRTKRLIDQLLGQKDIQKAIDGAKIVFSPAY